MKKSNLILVLGISIFLSGCFEEKTEEVHTVDWFMKNPTVLDETMKKCNNNPGELAETPNCKNAQKAQREIEIGSPSDMNW